MVDCVGSTGEDCAAGCAADGESGNFVTSSQPVAGAVPAALTAEASALTIAMPIVAGRCAGGDGSGWTAPWDLLFWICELLFWIRSPSGPKRQHCRLLFARSTR